MPLILFCIFVLFVVFVLFPLLIISGVDRYKVRKKAKHILNREVIVNKKVVEDAIREIERYYFTEESDFAKAEDISDIDKDLIERLRQMKITEK